jgi:hypothetical protein
MALIMTIVKYFEYMPQGPLMKFSTLEVAACVPCTCVAVRQNSLTQKLKTKPTQLLGSLLLDNTLSIQGLVL